MTTRGLIFAAPSSRSGKTTITLGLLRALAKTGHNVYPAKCGPDYIDTAYLCAAAGRQAVNLDAFAMSRNRLLSLVPPDGLLMIEGAMGLFDGAPPDGRGSAASLAKTLDLPIILIVDCASTAQSIAPLVSGFAQFDPYVKIAGLILNNIGSTRHEALIRTALKDTAIPILGLVPRSNSLRRPSRHLGLVQASEDQKISTFIETASDIISNHVDLEMVHGLAKQRPARTSTHCLRPLGNHIAVARDTAFQFFYEHIARDWQRLGAKISYFSPLKNEFPSAEADAIFLPGGYPELHAKELARAGQFRNAMKDAAGRNVTIYGECGGYMALGKDIVTSDGISYPMCDLLNVKTSFAKRKLHLGYRYCRANNGFLNGSYTAHEFHYSTVTQEDGTPLFTARDAQGCELAPMGLVKGSVSGSFAHIIDQVEQPSHE